jgi:hypothetical protein
MTAKWILAGAAACLFSTCCLAFPARFVSHNTVVSRQDPSLAIKLPSSFHYVGTDRFFLSKPELGNTEQCELFAFADSADGHHVRRYIWVQFEGYLPGHPELHMTYDSPRHANIGGLDFYEDEGVAYGTKTPKPGSDTERFYSLLASRGYQRSDLRWVRLVHLLDASKRQELMIIYAESLAGTGYTAAQLDKGGAEYSKWPAMDEDLRRRAEQSIKIVAAGH